MSGQCTGWVLRHGPGVRSQRAVLLTIADAANRDGEHSHPGVQAMCDGSLYSRSQVMKILRELVADGWVVVEEEGVGRGHATVYRVVMDSGRERSDDETIPADETVRSAPQKGPIEGAERSDSAAPLFIPNEEPTVTRDSEPPGSSATRIIVAHPDGSFEPLDLPWNVPGIVLEGVVLSPAIILCRRFSGLLAARGESGDAEARATSKGWVLPMEAMLRIDGRDPEAIDRVLTWLDAEADEVSSFWKPNVRSPQKLRLQWVRMSEQYERLRRKAAASGPPLSEEAARILAAERELSARTAPAGRVLPATGTGGPG